MRINLGEEGRLFAWFNGEFSRLLVARDEEEAYRKVIAARLRTGAGCGLEQARRWCRKNDTIEEIEVEGGLVHDAPYEGDLPEEDSDGCPF